MKANNRYFVTAILRKIKSKEQADKLKHVAEKTPEERKRAKLAGVLAGILNKKRTTKYKIWDEVFFHTTEALLACGIISDRCWCNLVEYADNNLFDFSHKEKIEKILNGKSPEEIEQEEEEMIRSDKRTARENAEWVADNLDAMVNCGLVWEAEKDSDDPTIEESITVTNNHNEIIECILYGLEVDVDTVANRVYTWCSGYCGCAKITPAASAAVREIAEKEIVLK